LRDLAASFFRPCSGIEGLVPVRTMDGDGSSHLAARNDAFFSLTRSDFFTRMLD
jgi:hypothetical protein